MTDQGSEGRRSSVWMSLGLWTQVVTPDRGGPSTRQGRSCLEITRGWGFSVRKEGSEGCGSERRGLWCPVSGYPSTRPTQGRVTVSFGGTRLLGLRSTVPHPGVPADPRRSGHAEPPGQDPGVSTSVVGTTGSLSPPPRHSVRSTGLVIPVSPLGPEPPVRTETTRNRHL